MRRDRQVLAMHHDVANRRYRHVVLQRLPQIAVVERHVNPKLGAGKEQSRNARVLLDRIDVSALGNSGHHVLPCLPTVMRTVDIGHIVGEAMAIDRRIGGLRIEMAGFDLRNLAPRGHRRRSHIVPVLPVVASDMNQTIVGAHPDQSWPAKAKARSNRPRRTGRSSADRYPSPSTGSRLAGTAGCSRARSGLIFSQVLPRLRERITN